MVDYPLQAIRSNTATYILSSEYISIGDRYSFSFFPFRCIPGPCARVIERLFVSNPYCTASDSFPLHNRNGDLLFYFDQLHSFNVRINIYSVMNRMDLPITTLSYVYINQFASLLVCCDLLVYFKDNL